MKRLVRGSSLVVVVAVLLSISDRNGVWVSDGCAAELALRTP